MGLKYTVLFNVCEINYVVDVYVVTFDRPLFRLHLIVPPLKLRHVPLIWNKNVQFTTT